MSIRPNRLKLGTSIATFAAFLVFLASVLIVGFNYYQGTRDTHVRTGELVANALRQTEQRVRALIAPVGPALNAISVLSRHADLKVNGGEALRPLVLPILQKNPQIASIYVGFEDGAFAQIVSFLGKGEAFREPYKVSADAGFAFVSTAVEGDRGGLRTVRPVLNDGESGGKTWTEATDYDPRKRPWYAPATQTAGVYRTPPYVFAKSRKPGLTLSKALAGDMKGVAGVDLDLRTLKAFLVSLKITPGTRLAIVTREGQILAHSHFDGVAVREASGTIINLHLQGLEATGDRILPKMIGSSGDDDKLRDVTVDDVRYLGRSIGLELGNGSVERLIIAIPWNELVAPLISARNKSILITLGIALAVMAIGFFVAHQIASPIEALSNDAERVGNLEIVEDAGTKSFVYEVDQLGEALHAMKARLTIAHRYLPGALVKQLIEGGSAGKIAGERRDVVIATCKVANLDNIADDQSSHDIMVQLSAFLESQSSTFRQHKGAVVNGTAGTLTALWNAPVQDEHKIRNACLAVLVARSALRGMNAEWARDSRPALDANYGFHDGSVLIGNAGSSDALQYTAIGKSARLAPQLAELGERLGAAILATEEISVSAGSEFLWKPVGLLSPDGFAEPLQIYELAGLKTATSSLEGIPAEAAETVELIDLWSRALNAFQAGDQETANSLFEQYNHEQPDDELAAFYSHLIRARKKRPALAPSGDLEVFGTWLETGTV